MLFLMACHDVSIGNPCDAEFVLSEPSLYTYSLMPTSCQLDFQHADKVFTSRKLKVSVKTLVYRQGV